MSDTHGEELPEETTPQGTQDDAVEFGHEDRDINLRQVIAWFLGTLVSTIVIQALLLGAWTQWRANEDRQNVPTSEVLRTAQPPPPAPLLEPNPLDLEQHKDEPMRLGPDYLHEYRVREDAELQRLGLQNATNGMPELPPAAAQTVASSGAAPLPVPPGSPMSAETPLASSGAAPVAPSPSTPDVLMRPMPSEASGGTAVENELK
jgi:hypothetical protein